DTLMVAAGGFLEPVSEKVARAYSGKASTAWDGTACESREAAIILNGTAAHALDYDDVYLDTMAHTGTVILPAILSGDETDAELIRTSFGAGLIAARAVAAATGQGHYHRGWHGT